MVAGIIARVDIPARGIAAAWGIVAVVAADSAMVQTEGVEAVDVPMEAMTAVMVTVMETVMVMGMVTETALKHVCLHAQMNNV